MRKIVWLAVCCLFLHSTVYPQADSSEIQLKKQTSVNGLNPLVLLQFEGDLNDLAGNSLQGAIPADVAFVEGIEGQALRLGSGQAPKGLKLDSSKLRMDRSHDFSVQFWIRTSMDSYKSAVILSQKEFADKRLPSQHEPGWVFYFSNGTWAWNMGSGERRITYERDNGTCMPLNDGKWHQLAMTYNCADSEVRLFFDGDNKVVYKVSDSNGFDFTSSSPLVIGGGGQGIAGESGILPEIRSGAVKLRELVDSFNSLGLGVMGDEELEALIVDPGELYDQKVGADESKKDNPKFSDSNKKENLKTVEQVRAELKKNPYTIHQAPSFMQVAPLLRIYSLAEGRVEIDSAEAEKYTSLVQLSRPEFDMDRLAVWDRVLSPEEVTESCTGFFNPDIPALQDKLPALTAAVWNIFHGGKHFEVDKDGWDSRKRIAEMLREENADVIMMQETYSSGDFIAAELGYYFATTVDWDYLNQGANISVLSRYPIKELFVPADAPFNNVGVKVAISKSQEIYVMSNWYGMNSFPVVFDFHKGRFEESDSIPTLFGGDFNAVPHTDGGDSPASIKMLEEGFTDAFRSLYPDVERHPGYSHRNGVRIDQLYYKGRGLKNTSTKIVSTRTDGFPSDHFLIISEFALEF